MGVVAVPGAHNESTPSASGDEDGDFCWRRMVAEFDDARLDAALKPSAVTW